MQPIERYDTIVIGAGVFGAWIATRLVESGERVLLIDQYGAASARASSGGASRVIRLAYGADAIYTRMAQQALRSWEQRLSAIGQPELLQRTGVLWMARQGQTAPQASLAVLAQVGARFRRLDAAALRTLYPQLRVPDDGWAIHEPDSGALLARRAVQALVQAAARAGLEWRIDEVLPAAPDASAVQTRHGATLRAGRWVYACGPWLGTLWPGLLGDKLFVTRQEVHYFGTPAGDPRFAPPQFPTWMDFDREWYGIPDLDGRGFKLACDVHGPAHDPDSAERLPTAAGIAAARRFLAERFPDLGQAPLLGSEVCQYENSDSGDFLIDQHPERSDIWLVGGGSGHGFKHGPAVADYLLGRLAGTQAAEPRFALAARGTRQQRQVH